MHTHTNTHTNINAPLLKKQTYADATTPVNPTPIANTVAKPAPDPITVTTTAPDIDINPYNSIADKTHTGHSKHILSPATFKTYISQLKGANDSIQLDVEHFNDKLKVCIYDVCVCVCIYVQCVCSIYVYMNVCMCVYVY